jgi:hypothetical protein
MPGTAFLKTAENWHNFQWHAAWDPYMWCKENLVRDSFSTLYLHLRLSCESEHHKGTNAEPVWNIYTGSPYFDESR